MSEAGGLTGGPGAMEQMPLLLARITRASSSRL